MSSSHSRMQQKVLEARLPKGKFGEYPDPLRNRLRNTLESYANRLLLKNARHIDEKATAEEWTRRIGENPVELMNVPPAAQSKEMAMQAVSAKSIMIFAVADHVLDEDIALAAVKQDGMLLEVMPPDLATQKVCDAAVAQNPEALLFVPDKLKTQEMCAGAWKRSVKTFSHIPDRFKTPEMCAETVRAVPWMLELVPNDLKTPEMGEIAVKKDPDLYLKLPVHCRTPAVNLIAVQSDPLNYRAVPKGMRTPEIREAGIKGALKWASTPAKERRVNAEDQLLYLHDDQRTKEVCLAALKTGATTTYLPDDLAADPDFRMKAIGIRPSIVRYLADATKQEWQAACRLEPALYSKVPQDMRGPGFYAETVAQSPLQILDVPASERTAEFYKETGYEMLRGLARKLTGEEQAEAADVRPGA